MGKLHTGMSRVRLSIFPPSISSADRPVRMVTMVTTVRLLQAHLRGNTAGINLNRGPYLILSLDPTPQPC